MDKLFRLVVVGILAVYCSFLCSMEDKREICSRFVEAIEERKNEDEALEILQHHYAILNQTNLQEAFRFAALCGFIKLIRAMKEHIERGLPQWDNLFKELLKLMEKKERETPQLLRERKSREDQKAMIDESERRKEIIRVLQELLQQPETSSSSAALIAPVRGAFNRNHSNFRSLPSLAQQIRIARQESTNATTQPQPLRPQAKPPLGYDI